MNVLALVLRAATINPDHDAVRDPNRSLSYGALAKEISLVAAGLRANGVRPNDRVVIRLSTSVDALVVAFGCMWVGATFIPVSVADPRARFAQILADCVPVAVIGRPGDDLPQGSWRSVTFEDLTNDLERTSGGPSEEGSAYCIYTSGTTGTPKGVVIGHEAFSHAIRATVATLGMGRHTRTICVSAFHFDGSFASLFTTLSAGGSLVILRREPMVLPRAFVRTVLAERINTAFCSPSFLRLLLSSDAIGELATSDLVQIIFGGEASSARHLQELCAALPKTKFYNQYGPTETTISVALHEVSKVEVDAGQVPIGKPHSGVTFALFNENKTLPVIAQETGELFIGGPQLMDGYWNDPELSAQVLRTDLIPGTTLYQTGDLVRRNSADDLIYEGRADRVIKRTGVRISLDEIERLVCQLPGVINAGCIATIGDDETSISVYAAVTGNSTPAELLAALELSLPRTMMPNVLTIVASIPLTAAGKVDYRSLNSAVAG